jgi:hypothetical protein
MRRNTRRAWSVSLFGTAVARAKVKECVKVKEFANFKKFASV